MSFTVPVRGISSRCLFSQPLTIRSRSTPLPARLQKIHQPQRQFADSSRKCKEPTPNPVLDEFRRNNPGAEKPVSNEPTAEQRAAQLTPGDLGSTSIFEDDRRIQQQAERANAAAEGRPDPAMVTTSEGRAAPRDPSNSLLVLDPDPNSRERWQRKRVIQMVRRSGRVTRTQLLKRTEREHLSRSHNLKTSVKKLGMLARQIAGKTLDDAIVQMRFSRKKVAQDVLKQLEKARDEAVVMRGMGLGQVRVNASENVDTAASSEGDTAAGTEPAAVQIQLKDGKRHIVTNPSQIYIDQAWVGRGPYGKLPDYRARGRVYLLRTPWTSISLLLKEETTRVREWQQREEKRRKQRLEKVWVPLPDRPISTKQPWYSW